MSSSPLAVFLSLLLYFSLSTSGQHFYRNSLDPPRPSVSSPPAAKIQLACKATRFPDSCVDSITRSGKVGPDTDSVKIIRTAVSISFENLKKAQSMVKTIMDSSAGNTTRLVAAYSCIQSLGYSDYRIVSTDNALTRGRIKDARAWMSAALANQDGCVSGLKKINDTKQVGETMSFLKSLMGFSTNALGMMASYDNFGNDVRLWIPPATERDGFWEKAGTGGGGRTLAFPSGLTANVTVCKAEGEGCNYKKVQDAVNEAPDYDRTRRFVIRIKEGVYEETVRVPFEKKNVVFVGDGMGKTVITGSANVGQPGMTTYNSSTVGVLGDGFMARDITIQNTAGPNAHQAVAFRSDSDMSIVENCEFLGHQDTFYPHSLRQFYKSCRITGNVDFIFGNAAAFFQDCKILINPRQVTPEKGENNAVTAQGRTDPSQTTGFVFSNCTINGTEEYMRLFRSKPEVHKNFLGRPWKEFSRTVFIGCNFEALISPGGWMPWNGEFALKTLFYGEYKNAGPGSDTSRRVPWSSQISPEHSDVYSVENFIQASGWTTALTS